MVQRPLQDVRGEVVACGEDLVAGADPEVRVGTFGGAAGGGADDVEVDLSSRGSSWATASRTVSASSGSSPVGGVPATSQWVTASRVGSSSAGVTKVIRTSWASMTRWHTRSRTSRPAPPEGCTKSSSGSSATAVRNSSHEREKRSTSARQRGGATADKHVRTGPRQLHGYSNSPSGATGFFPERVVSRHRRARRPDGTLGGPEGPHREGTAVRPDEITEALNRPIGQEPPARDLTRRPASPRTAHPETFRSGSPGTRPSRMSSTASRTSIPRRAAPTG